MKRVKLTFTFIGLLTICFASYAVTASPDPISVTQPDGSVIEIRIHGDEFLNWTTCGNSLVAKGDDGFYHYAAFTAEGVSAVLGNRVLSTQPGDGTSVLPPESAIAEALRKRQKFENMALQTKPALMAPAMTKSISKGENRFLVLLIEFNDLYFTVSDPKAAFTNLLNQKGYNGTGSVKDYFEDQAGGEFRPVFDVEGPVRVSGNMASYSVDKGITANGAPRLLVEACNLIDESVDFSQYDLNGDGVIENVFFFFAGHNFSEGVPGTIWPHSWHAVHYGVYYYDGKLLDRYGCTSEYKQASGKKMAGIGTFCHEFGHVLGLPDFYDTDYGVNGWGTGLDRFSLMASGNYNNGGNSPPYFNYEERTIMGWSHELILLEEGTNVLEPLHTFKSYYTPTENKGEYYLYECRPKTGWDSYISGYSSGMLIYQVDRSTNMVGTKTAKERWIIPSGVNSFGDHQCFRLVPSNSEAMDCREFIFPVSLNGVLYGSSFTTAVEWSGKATGYDLTDIVFDNSEVKSKLQLSIAKKVYGKVTTSDSSAIQGIPVEITGVDCSFSSSVPTGTDGSYSFILPKWGKYALKVKKEGYTALMDTVDVSTAAVNRQLVLTTVLNDSGFSYINVPDGLTAGSELNLSISVGKGAEQPASVIWLFNGTEKANGEKVQLVSGRNTLVTRITFTSGERQTLKSVITVD